jgi:DNA helicase HerA-like ATPase
MLAGVGPAAGRSDCGRLFGFWLTVGLLSDRSQGDCLIALAIRCRLQADLDGCADRVCGCDDNVIILEEAHNLLLAKQAGAKESVLESSIRMIRQYGLGYVFVDQSASLLSKVAFANSYATIALSQKLRADVQTIAGAMNLTEEQRDSLSTLPIGTSVVRLADEHPEPFMVVTVWSSGRTMVFGCR